MGILFLFACAACKKSTPPWYAASFLGSFNGAPTYPVDFTGPVDQLSCDQSYYTGGGTKVSRWTFSFHSSINNGTFVLIIPSTDSSNTMPVGKTLNYTSGSQSPSQGFELTVAGGGSAYSGTDSTTFAITFSLFDKKTTADFTGSLHGPNGTYIITEGSFTDVPITYAQ
jgi:hypothetical protein